MPTYHVSPAGDDGHDGLSPSTAWQTIAHVNAQTYVAGDMVLFEGGQTLIGALSFGPSSWPPSPSTPVTFGSYGSGRATISSGALSGFTATSIANLVVVDLIFVGDGAHVVNGIEIVNSLTGNGKLSYIRVINCDVSGYGANGVWVAGGYGPSGDNETIHAGFDDVLIDGVVSHANTNVYTGGSGSGGIMVTGVYGFNADPTHPTHTNVTIRNCTAHDNSGAAGAGNWTGSGIFLAQTRVGMISNCVAYSNGASHNQSAGPVGIWTADADQVTIQFCESYNNTTAGTYDGCGFNLDGGCTNCRIQYCYSHGNRGPGFMLFQYDDPGYQASWDSNTLRYSISENDIGSENAQQGALLIGSDASFGLTNVVVHNLTIYKSSATAILVNCYAASGLIANCIFYSAANAWLVHTQATNPTGLHFRGNDYYATGTWRINWANTTYSTLSAWRTARSQELEGGNNTGNSVDPLLTSPGNGGTIGGYVSGQPSAYKLQAGSPMINTGLNLSSLFGISAGSVDFYGVSITGPYGVVDVGASEAVSQITYDRTAAIASTPVAPSIGTSVGTVSWLTPLSGVTLVGSAVSQWNDASGVAWVSSGAAVDLHADCNIISTLAAVTSAATALVPIQLTIASSIPAITSAANASVDQITSTIPAITSQMEARVSAILQPANWHAIYYRGQRALRVYVGNQLVKDWPQGSLFDADGNQLVLTLADGTPVTLEVE